jgi:hypothetical protein
MAERAKDAMGNTLVSLQQVSVSEVSRMREALEVLSNNVAVRARLMDALFHGPPARESYTCLCTARVAISDPRPRCLTLTGLAPSYRPLLSPGKRRRHS